MKIAISVSEKEKRKGQESPYFKALLEAGAKPEELQLITAADAGQARAEHFDGVLFAGGEDVDPAFYDESKKHENVYTDLERDKFEFAWLDRARRERLPVLGICRGAQMVNVKFGGSLYQDLKSDWTPEATAPEISHRQPGERSDLTHDVTVTDPESRLAEVFQGSCRVNSLHHQAIRRVGRGLKVSAYSEDGLVEAIEAADNDSYLLAVQWHPEELAQRPEQKKLLERFLAECRAQEQNKSAVVNR